MIEIPLGDSMLRVDFRLSHLLKKFEQCSRVPEEKRNNKHREKHQAIILELNNICNDYFIKYQELDNETKASEYGVNIKKLVDILRHKIDPSVSALNFVAMTKSVANFNVGMSELFTRLKKDYNQFSDIINSYPEPWNESIKGKSHIAYGKDIRKLLETLSDIKNNLMSQLSAEYINKHYPLAATIEHY